ncbi:MAG: ABC transporter ATP-binding protein [bacterium]|nr:ABC transporter ATP-binding protein [bacterium]
MIELTGINHSYRKNRSGLRDINLTIEAGESVVLLGANGTGKSSLLKIINGLIFPASGRYLFEGEPVTKRSCRRADFVREFRQSVVLLFQNPDAMIFNPTVFDEIAFGPRQLGLQDVDDKVRHWAHLLDLEHYLDRPPFQLSSGEKQRLCLAALLILDPRVLLLDEPTSYLDPGTTGWLVDFLRGLELTTISSTHNLSLAPELGRRTVLLSRDRSVAYDGPTDELLADRELLKTAGLTHIHGHEHDGVEHRHYHTHDWD